MTDPKEHRTRTGRILTDDDIDAIAREVEEADYDVETQEPTTGTTHHGVTTCRCRAGQNRP